MSLTPEQEQRLVSAQHAYKAQYIRELVAFAEELRAVFYEGQGALTYWFQAGFGDQAPNEITEADLANADVPFTPAQLQTFMGTIDSILNTAESQGWIAPVSAIAKFKR
jgi:hypothetical protein